MVKINRITKFIPAYLLTVSVISSLAFPFQVKATEVVISDNNEGSQNSITVNNSSSTSTSQNNSGTTSTSVNIDANTGGNEIVDTTGSQSSIDTGDVAIETSVQNSANSSIIEVGCCIEDSANVVIFGNGSDSQNEVSLNLDTQTDISINQNASISNKVAGSANTGGNSISNSNGSASISTGNIKIWGKVENGPINTAQVKVGQLENIDNLSVWISNNNSNSVNTINLDFDNDNSFLVYNSASIVNDVFWNLSTGDNEMDGILGNVSITTGGIDFAFLIQNGPINSSIIDFDCCFLEGVGGPGDVNDSGEEAGRGSSSDDNDNNDGDGSSSSSSSGILLGLSDTSSEEANALLFFAGLILMGLGGKIVSSEVSAFFVNVCKKDKKN